MQNDIKTRAKQHPVSASLQPQLLPWLEPPGRPSDCDQQPERWQDKWMRSLGPRTLTICLALAKTAACEPADSAMASLGGYVSLPTGFHPRDGASGSAHRSAVVARRLNVCVGSVEGSTGAALLPIHKAGSPPRVGLESWHIEPGFLRGGDHADFSRASWEGNEPAEGWRSN